MCIRDSYLGKRFPDHSAPAYLLLRFDGNTLAAIEEAYDDVAKLCLERGALDVLISDTQERDESIWTARGAFLEAIKGIDVYKRQSPWCRPCAFPTPPGTGRP